MSVNDSLERADNVCDGNDDEIPVRLDIGIVCLTLNRLLSDICFDWFIRVKTNELLVELDDDAVEESVLNTALLKSS